MNKRMEKILATIKIEFWKAFVAIVPAGYFVFNRTNKGLAAASVKTLKGLAIASVKTKKGLN